MSDIQKIVDQSIKSVVSEGNMYTLDQMKEAAAKRPIYGPLRKTPPGTLEKAGDTAKSAYAFIKKGKIGDAIYNKLNPNKAKEAAADEGVKLAKGIVAGRGREANLARNLKSLEGEKDFYKTTADFEQKRGAGSHFGKAVKLAAKDIYGGGFTTKLKEMSGPRTGILAASALAAGLGALALRKKMKEAAKKGKK